MKNSTYLLLLILLTAYEGQAQNCDASGYPVDSELPNWVTTLGTPYNQQQPNEWGMLDMSVPYSQLVSLSGAGFNNRFGISGIGNLDDHERQVVLLLVDPSRNSSDGLIYGVYAQNDEEYFADRSWDETLLIERMGTIECSDVMLSTTNHRKRAHTIFFGNCVDLAPLQGFFSHYNGTSVDVRVMVITYGTTQISDFTYKVPSIYNGKTGLPNQGALTCANFQTQYRTLPDAWGMPGQVDSHPTMTWDADSHELEITANENVTTSDVDIPGTALVVWGKMLTYDDGVTPEIKPSYNYGLWVAGEIVTEDFKMWPRNEDTNTWPAWPDYVFADTYELPTLKEMAAHVHAHGHLPGVPSAAAIKEGYSQHEINRVFLEKIEQLTLYKVDHRERLEDMQAQLTAAQDKMTELRTHLAQRE